MGRDSDLSQQRRRWGRWGRRWKRRRRWEEKEDEEDEDLLLLFSAVVVANFSAASFALAVLWQQ